jgi:carbamoyl-phosphate synthase small subunit
MTYPLIGNYGTNELDQESRQPYVRGFVVEELSEMDSNWRSDKHLGDYLKEWGICGIEGIDTRALTKHLRTRGAMKGCLSSEGIGEQAAIERAKKSSGVLGQDFVQAVTTNEVYTWDKDDEESGSWNIVSSLRPDTYQTNMPHRIFDELPEARYNIVAYDLGMKKNILRKLRQQGFRVTVVPAGTSAEEVMALKPEGIFLSNGPGDPGAIPYVYSELKKLIGQVPIFGICLGHQMLGLAMGGKRFKLPFGHRGGNQPVKDLITGKVAITSQNHGFAIDSDSLPPEIEVTHVNLNDHTVEGLRHKNEPVFSVQYHPEAAPGPHDASYFFQQFANLVEDNRAKS